MSNGLSPLNHILLHSSGKVFPKVPLGILILRYSMANGKMIKDSWEIQHTLHPPHLRDA